MYKKIFFALILFGASLSYARSGRPARISDEGKAAIESCGLSLPQRGQRPSREEHQKIKSCLEEAGIERPSRERRGEGHRRSQEYFESGAVE